MTVEKVIRLSDVLKPNKLPTELKLQYVNEVEGIVQTDIMLLSSEDIVTYDENMMETELLVKPPHDKIYKDYLAAMIDFAHGEYDKFANSIQLFNTHLSEYTSWYARNYHPADGKAVVSGYYLSAYGIAVKYGYTGTEEEWIASLPGEDGLTPYIGENGNWWIGDTDTGVYAGNEGGGEGTPGVGIESVTQTTTSTEDGGVNIVTVRLTDGTSSTFTVRNGSRGSQGPMGPMGPAGSNGLTPHIGENGNWWIGDTDTGVPASGSGGGVPGVGIASVTQTTTSTEDNGENVVTVRLTNGTSSTFSVRNGSKGSKGDSIKGDPGITPHIGANGNWFIGDTDTGVSAGGSGGYVIEQHRLDVPHTGWNKDYDFSCWYKSLPPIPYHDGSGYVYSWVDTVLVSLINGGYGYSAERSKAWAAVTEVQFISDEVILYATEPPSVDISLNVVVMRGVVKE